MTNLDGEDMAVVREIASLPDAFRLISHSICPGIYGHELVKGAPRLRSSSFFANVYIYGLCMCVFCYLTVDCCQLA